MHTKLDSAVCLIALVAVFVPTEVRAVSLESFDTQTFAGPAAAGAFNFTVANNDNRLLLVGYQHERSVTPGNRIQTLTYGGTPLTLAISQANPTDQEIAEIWYLVNPPVGNASLSATLDGATEGGRGFRLTAFDVFDAAQTAPEAVAGSGNQSPNISTPITTLMDDALLFGLTHNQASSTYTPGAGVTELFEQDAVSINAAFGIKPIAIAGLTSFDWTQSGAANLDVQAVVAIGNALAVPEPAGIAIWSLLGLGLCGYGLLRRRRKK